MKRLVTVTLILSTVGGMLSFIPALLITSALGLGTQYAFVYALMIGLGCMLVLPIPFGISMRREQRDIARISAQLGGNSFVCHVNIVTKYNTVAGYLGFNNTSMRLVGMLDRKEYNILVSDNADAVVDFCEQPDVTIHTMKKKEYRVLVPQADILLGALKALGWRVVEEQTEDFE